MNPPASSSGLPSTSGQKTTPITPTPMALSPGQIVSARVLDALGADTYLLALRGRTLVAHSPTLLMPDTIVQLAVQAADDSTSPVPVKLLATPSLAGTALAASLLGEQTSSPTAETRVATMIAELGLPPGPAATATVAAFIRLGVPLADPRAGSQTKPSGALRSTVQVVQAAMDAEVDATIDSESSIETARESTGTPASGSLIKNSALNINPTINQPIPHGTTSALTAQEKKSSHLSIAPATGQVIATAHTPTADASAAPRGDASPLAEASPEQPSTADDAHASASTSKRTQSADPYRAALPRTNEPRINEPRISGTPSLVSQARLTLGAYGLVSFTSTAPAVLVTPSSTVSPHTRDTLASPVTAPMQHEENAPLVAPSTTGDVRKETDGSGAMVRPTAAEPMMDTYGPSTSRSRRPEGIGTATPVTDNETTRTLQRNAVTRSGGLPTAAANITTARLNSAKTPLDTPVTGAIPNTPRRSGIVSPVPASAMAQVIATATANDLATAGARLARASLPVTPATLAVALRAPNAQPAAVARWLPPVLARAIDPQVSSPPAAMRMALQLAGVVPAGMTTDPAQTLLQHLIRVAISVGSATPVTASPLTSETETDSLPGTAVPKTSADAIAAAPGPALITESGPDETTTPAGTSTSTTNETPRGADPTMAAVHEVAAEQLVPPTHLDDYDRIIALPMMHAGQPVPARLAVTTRRTASGGTACWMRVDCALSQLGSVSVRLSGADGGPVAVTLIAAPAAAAVLAQALPALTEDLHAKGVVAALRVVAHDGDLTEVA